jgi:hypothetical protein
MTRLATALVALTLLAAPFATPVAAQTLTVLLPSISFPGTLTTSTKGCETVQTAAPVCQLGQ